MSQQQPLVVYSHNKQQFMTNIITMMVAIIAAVTMSAFIVKAVVQGEIARAEGNEVQTSEYRGGGGCSGETVIQSGGDASANPVQNVGGGSATGAAGGSATGSGGSGGGGFKGGKVVQNTTVTNTTNNSYVKDSYNNHSRDYSKTVSINDSFNKEVKIEESFNKTVTDSFNYKSYNEDNDKTFNFTKNTTTNTNSNNTTVDSHNVDVDVDIDVDKDGGKKDDHRGPTGPYVPQYR